MAPSEEKKIALRKKKDILPQGEKFPCARREISVRMKEKTKCSGEGGRMSWCISELRVQGTENEMR